MKAKRYIKRVGDIVLLLPYEWTLFPFKLEQSELSADALDSMEEGKLYEVTISVDIKTI